MEETDHVMLVGNGAKNFAISHGFKEDNLLDAVAYIGAWQNYINEEHNNPSKIPREGESEKEVKINESIKN